MTRRGRGEGSITRTAPSILPIVDWSYFEANVQRGNECWLWVGTCDNFGYGRIGLRRWINWKAHRFVWILHNGPIPAGLFVLHHCDNPPCVRPDHLFLGTQADNLRDAAQKKRVRGGWHRGEEMDNAKLTDEKVRYIRLAWPFVSTRDLAQELGVSRRAIQLVLHGKSWRHVDAA